MIRVRSVVLPERVLEMRLKLLFLFFFFFIPLATATQTINDTVYYATSSGTTLNITYTITVDSIFSNSTDIVLINLFVDHDMYKNNIIYTRPTLSNVNLTLNDGATYLITNPTSSAASPTSGGSSGGGATTTSSTTTTFHIPSNVTVFEDVKAVVKNIVEFLFNTSNTTNVYESVTGNLTEQIEEEIESKLEPKKEIENKTLIIWLSVGLIVLLLVIIGVIYLRE